MNLKKLFAALGITSAITAIATSISAFADEAADSATGTEPVSGWAQILPLIISFGLLAVVFYFFILRPQKKQQRETQQMRDSITRGDIVVTAGGIVGMVITVKEDMVLLESSGDKTKIQLQKWAISSILEKAQ